MLCFLQQGQHLKPLHGVCSDNSCSQGLACWNEIRVRIPCAHHLQELWVLDHVQWHASAHHKPHQVSQGCSGVQLWIVLHRAGNIALVTWHYRRVNLRILCWVVVLEVFLEACCVALCTRYRSLSSAPVNCALACCELACCRDYLLVVPPVGRVFYGPPSLPCSFSCRRSPSCCG